MKYYSIKYDKKPNFLRASIFSLFILSTLLNTTNLNAKKYEHLAATPPMGWNSWNHYACDIDEKIIREVAHSMLKFGMKDLGYEYINIDDCWQGERDKQGNIQADKKRFPSGI